LTSWCPASPGPLLHTHKEAVFDRLKVFLGGARRTAREEIAQAAHEREPRATVGPVVIVTSFRLGNRNVRIRLANTLRYSSVVRIERRRLSPMSRPPPNWAAGAGIVTLMSDANGSIGAGDVS